MDPRTLELLAKMGVSHANRINDCLNADAGLSKMVDKQMVIAVACYTAALAKHTKLDLNDLVDLIVSVYDNTEISKKDPSPEPEKEGN